VRLDCAQGTFRRYPPRRGEPGRGLSGLSRSLADLTGLRSSSGSLAKFAAMRRASLLLGLEEPRRENFAEFVLLNPRAASRAVDATGIGENEDLADVLPGDVDAVIRQLQALAQRR
jgi:hypothetical protein